MQVYDVRFDVAQMLSNDSIAPTTLLTNGRFLLGRSLTFMKPPIRYLRIFLLLLGSAAGAGLVWFGKSALSEAFSGSASDTPAMVARDFVALIGSGSVAFGATILVLTATAAYVTRRVRLGPEIDE